MAFRVKKGKKVGESIVVCETCEAETTVANAVFFGVDPFECSGPKTCGYAASPVRVNFDALVKAAKGTAEGGDADVPRT